MVEGLEVGLGTVSPHLKESLSLPNTRQVLFSRKRNPIPLIRGSLTCLLRDLMGGIRIGVLDINLSESSYIHHDASKPIIIIKSQPSIQSCSQLALILMLTLLTELKLTKKISQHGKTRKRYIHYITLTQALNRGRMTSIKRAKGRRSGL